MREGFCYKGRFCEVRLWASLLFPSFSSQSDYQWETMHEVPQLQNFEDHVFDFHHCSCRKQLAILGLSVRKAFLKTPSVTLISEKAVAPSDSDLPIAATR